MSMTLFAACRRPLYQLKALYALVLVASAAIAQTPTPTPEQLNLFKNLPSDQQQSLLDSVLGKSDGSSRKSDSKLDSPETLQRRNDRLGGRAEDRKNIGKTADGRTLRQTNEDPELRAGDSILIDLTPVELAARLAGDSAGAAGQSAGRPNQGTSGSPPNGAAAAGNAQAAAAAANATPKSEAPDFGRIRFGAGVRTPEELALTARIRERILKGNPYKLNGYGVLEIPGLPSMPMAGLTAEEATRRLSADPDLRDYVVKLTLLRLEPLDEASAKPFGYDLFEGAPSTFAPVNDIQVPIDYVIGPGDTFNIQLYGSEPGTYTLTVQRDGRINFPKLGPVAVSGMGFDSARSTIEQRVAQQLIGTKVSVTMGDLREIRVFVLGDVQKPGSYTVSGLSTMTNALLASGGVKTVGSLRNIELKRNGHLVSVLDLYDLLLHGNTSGDHLLLPGDVIFIPPIGRTVTVFGALRRPAVYELKNEKTPEQLIEIAGGLMADADGKAAQLEHIDSSHRREMRNVDLTSRGALGIELLDGDKLRVPAIRPVLENSVQLSGDVYRPGAFQYRAGLRLSDVLNSFDDLHPSADRHYVVIRREVPPQEKIVVISADLERALTARGSADDPLLQPRDKIVVFDLTANRARTVAPIIDSLELQATANAPAQVVSVDGPVRVPGRYPLEPSMHVSDLIRAGGSLDAAAYTAEAELTRYQVVGGNERQTDLIPVNLAAIRRGDPGADLQLKPYDILVIKKTPQWEEPGSITLTGEVRYPGTYPIHRGETLSSALRRAGGLTDLAFDEGTVFIRDELKKREQEQLEVLSNRLQSDLAALSLEALSTSAATGSNSGAGAAQGLAIGQQLIEQLRNTKPVGRLVIDVRRVMKGPTGGAGDVVLRDGDQLLVPKKTQEITVLGEVQSPTSHIYLNGLTRNEYIAKSGGATQKADFKRIYVVRANGDVVSGGRGGWFRKTQAVDMRPGDTIVVPLDTERVKGLPLWTSVTTIIYNLAVALLAIRSV